MSNIEKRETKGCDFSTIIYGDYVFTPIANAFNDMISVWLSKKGFTMAYYCFSVRSSDTKEFARQTDINSVDSYIHAFTNKLNESGKSINEYLMQRKVYKVLPYEYLWETFKSIFCEMGYYLTPFISNMNYRLKDVKNEQEKKQLFVDELRKVVGSEINYREPNCVGVSTTDVFINESVNYWEVSGIVTKGIFFK